MLLSEVAGKALYEASERFQKAAGDYNLLSQQITLADANASLRLAEVASLVSIAKSLEEILITLQGRNPP